MAAESLKKKGGNAGYEVRVETQGSIGAENVLNEEEIREADVVVIAADININIDRFKEKSVYKCKTLDAIKNPVDVIEKALAEAIKEEPKKIEAKPKKESEEKKDSNILKHILSGIAYMSPMGMIAGLLLAIANIFGVYENSLGQAVTSGAIGSEQLNYLAIKLYEIGNIALLLAIPLFAGFVANSIGDRPAIVPAMLGAYLGNSPDFLGKEYGGGFIFALIIAFVVGYTVVLIKKIKWPDFIKSLLSWLIIPIVTTAITILLVLILGGPVASIMDTIYVWIAKINSEFIIVTFIVGAIIGGMIGAGLGGPLNKIALVIGAAVFIDTISKFGVSGANFIPQTAAQAAISVAPLGIWLASVLFKDKFKGEDEKIAKDSLKKGILGITEGAIPYAKKHGQKVSLGITLGSALAGGLVAITGCKFFVGIGSPLGAIIGYIQQPLPIITWVGSIFAGVLLMALMIGFTIKEEK